MTNSPRPVPRLLVLDAGGVILSNQMPQLYRDLAEDAGGTLDDVDAAYLPLRVDLWSGALDERRFWELLLTTLEIASSAQTWQARVAELIQPALPVEVLQSWAAKTPVWVLSNHRSEWLLPALDRYGYTPFIARTIVSDATGLVKPAEDCCRYLVEHYDGPADDILFVDDKVRNLAPAHAHGIATLEADPDGRWVAQCSKWLGA